MLRAPPAPFTCPKLASPNVTSGLLNCGVFVALNQSDRNSRLNRSVSRKTLANEESRLKKFGPESMYRPTFPKVTVLLLAVNGSWNTEVSNHSWVSTPFGSAIGPVTQGDWWFPGVLSVWQLHPKLKGVPVMKVTTLLKRQPPKSVFSGPF